MTGRASLLLSLIVAASSSGIAADTAVCKNATIADIVFLVDGSSSIGRGNFQEIRSFLRSFTRTLDIGPNKVRIGVAQYSGEPHQEFLLNENMDRKSLLAAVEKIPYREGGTETGKAIDFLRTTYFTEDAGSRASQRVPQIAVVITDGDSTDDVVAPAQRLRKHGVIVFGIRVGGANLQEFESIVNWPPERFLSSIDSYQALQRLTVGLLQTVCESMEEQRQALANRFGDIFFLVDSGITQRRLSIFKTDLIKLITQLNVSASTYRVGLAQYGQDVQVEFLLNAFQTKSQTQVAVKRFRLSPQPNQPHNLGRALHYANTHFFTREAGGRAHQGTPQTLVVVTGKASDDPVSRAVLKVRSAGVTVYGMSAGAPMEAIELFASDQHAFDSPRVLLLKDFFLTEKKESVTEDCKGANVADIVFIVDESGSIGPENFQLVRSFLRSIVSSLEVRPSRVQVGIVTYNTVATAQVYLDTFTDQEDIFQFINLLPYRGGGTNTGAALNFTLEEIFIEKKGSRKEKGVQQVAVVITDGKSNDNVSEEALGLRRAGVTVYAVGIGEADKSELIEMASYPPDRHVFIVNNFTELKPLKQSLQKILCENLFAQAIKVSTRRSDIQQACVQKNEADIYFLMDDSGSIGNQDFQDMKDFIIKFLQTFHIGPEHVRVGLVKYADSPTTEFELTAHSDAQTMEQAINHISHDGGGTETGEALEFMGPFFQRAMVSRGHKVPEYLIVITDGESTDEVKSPAEKLRAQGVIIYAIGVKESNKTQLLEIAGEPKRSIFVGNFDALKSINSDIITDICTEDACRDIQGDVFFLSDSSESISKEDFQTMKMFMKSAISKFALGENKVHVGVMQFSTNHNLEFPLNRYYTKEDILNAIDDMQQMSEGTHTGKAITEVSQYFDATRGGRPDLNQRLIVITDGASKDEVKGAAEALRAKGVVVYAIGVVDANTTQLVEISGSMDRVYAEKDFDALKDLESQVAMDVCKRECNIEKADIIFLVDSSKSILPPQYESMQKFMESIVNQTTVGKDRTRFGLISYSDEPMSHFTLNTYYSKRRVLAAIPNVKPPEGDTYTGKALEYSLQFFNAEHGGRKGLKVPQILMVITDGAATNPYNLKEPSDALRNNGVTVVSIGVDQARRDQLETMAGGDTSKVFKVDNFEGLETLYSNMSTVLCIKPACEKADLVFLLDRSSSINLDDYKIMINFTVDLLDSFEVGEESVHVGLAQFSDDPQDEFFLDKYMKKEQCISHIRNMAYTGGNTNIGKALHRIKDYFEVSRGSRPTIPKNLVLITDGNSHDDVKDSAYVLRALGIEVFAIGVGDVRMLSLLQITGSSDRLFDVRSFNELANVKQQVVESICDEPEPPPIPPTPRPSDCSIDIAMGFDVSGAPGEMLISGHPNLQTFLPQIANYITSVKSLCCVGPAPIRTKMSFRVVGHDGRSWDDFKFEGYSEDIVNKVMALTLTEPTYFNTALLKSFREKFKTESKADVKVLLIFSDGLDEDLMKLEHESELLRQSGISALLTVALEGVRDPAQLHMVEFGRGFGYELPLSIGMRNVASTVLRQIDLVSDRECCNVMCKCSGRDGVPGPPGQPGSKGPSGLKGQPGFPGEEGGAGERGPPGPHGPQGMEGCPGPRGLKGYRGVSGNRGADGEDGLDGVNGEQGLTGPDGARGDRGDPGNPGIPGIRGEAGLKGERGLRGDLGEPGADNTSPGAKGELGNPGLPGLSGLDGEPGDDGGPGDPGPGGRRGSVGEKGLPGDAGDPGPEGSPGAPGPQGRRGRNGDRGPKGVFGFPGPQGGPGPAGDPGSAGRRGANGQKGQQGDPGVKGAPESLGPRGMPGQDGRDGSGPSGPPGVKGDPGFPGYPGLLGEDGLEGTKGYPGPKGNRGRPGNSGGPGESGGPGDLGHPGQRGPRGPPGHRDMTECQLITYIRNNCACYRGTCESQQHGGSECPAYPTELVLGLDMSEDVTPAAFERQRSALLALLEDITISESNCPTGARVAVVGYSAYTKYLIRFQDYRRKNQLIESVKNIALERTSNRRQLGAAMRFVGQNVFKRIRSGVMMRKVAVFLSNGPSQDVNDIVTAVMEYSGLNIVPVVISLRNAPAIGRALEVDDSGRSMFTVLGRDVAADLKKVQNCAICYDPCKRSDQCAFVQDPVQPQEVDMDLVMVADSSREMQADEYAGVQQLLGSVVEQLAVSPQPRRAGNQARVALVQQSGTQATKVEFGLGTYQTSNLMRRHLIRNMTLQGGSSALGRTLDFTLKEVLLKAGQPRRRRVLLTVVGTQTAYEDRAKLRYISQKAKCEGVAVFVVTVGERYDRTQVEELAGLPVQQHLIHMGRLKADEQGYAQRFFRVFLSALAKGMNSYPPPSLKPTCDQLTEPDDAQIFNIQDWGQGLAELGDEVPEELGDEVPEELGDEVLEELGDEVPEELGDEVREQIGGRTLDVFSSPNRGGGQSFLSADHLHDSCLLSQDVGSCHNYSLMWFYNVHEGRCSRFWYSGCGGNGNRFHTLKDCEERCLTKSRLAGAGAAEGGGGGRGGAAAGRGGAAAGGGGGRGGAAAGGGGRGGAAGAAGGVGGVQRQRRLKKTVH